MGEKLVGSGKLLAASDVVDHPVADVLRTFQLIFDCLHVVMHWIHHLHLDVSLLTKVAFGHFSFVTCVVREVLTKYF